MTGVFEGASGQANNVSVSITFGLGGWPAAACLIGITAILSVTYYATYKLNEFEAA